MDKDEQIAKLKAALGWALEEGANGGLDKDGKLCLYDGGCGCCQGRAQPPEHLRAVIVDALTSVPTGDGSEK